MLVCGVGSWQSLIAALTYSLGSYFFLIVGAGHNSKAIAIGFMAPTIAGLLLAYKGKYIKAFILFSLAIALQIRIGHYQITYYTLYLGLIIGAFKLVNAIKENTLPKYLKGTATIILAAMIALACNFSKLYGTKGYVDHSTRGKSELTEKASNLTAQQKANKTSGLDRDYITQWSMGVSESLTTFIPYIKGTSTASLPNDSKTIEYIKSQQNGQVDPKMKKTPYYFGISMYWGDQPMTSSIYFGAIVMFLFILSLFYIDNKYKWWILTATILAYVLSWGKNMPITTDFFIDYVPMYNKFRTVSMILVIANFTVVLSAFLGLNKLLSGDFKTPASFGKSRFKINKDYHTNSILLAFLMTGGLCLFLFMFGRYMFDFNAPSDIRFNKNGYQELLNCIIEDRISLFKSDAIRSFTFIALAAAALYSFIIKKIKKEYFLIGLTVLIFADMWTIDKRFLTNDDFKTKRSVKVPFKKSSADKEILKDKSYYRVFDNTVDAFNTNATSYYHKSVGGYSAAKLKIYQELIEHHISKFNQSVFNMLNTKYFIVADKKGSKHAKFNPDALGNAWFINNIEFVENADAEIAALKSFNPAETAFVDKRFTDQIVNYSKVKDSISTIRLTNYNPDHMVYEAVCGSPKATIFSEIYYHPGWTAYIDGEAVPHFKANYVLRGLIIPEGKHKIEFKFMPESFLLGETVSLISSIILLLCAAILIIHESIKFFKKENQPATKQ